MCFYFTIKIMSGFHKNNYKLKNKYIYIVCGEFDDLLSSLRTACGLLIVNIILLTVVIDHLGGHTFLTDIFS